jgi:hypothetical protein
LIEAELDSVERRFSVDLGRNNNSTAINDDDYFPQFEERFRKQSAAMAKHYEIFYCLENALRQTVRSKLEAEFGLQWWDTAVPQSAKDEADYNMKREQDTGVNMRSADPLDYITFGQLGEIVRSQWEHFSDTFNSQKAFNKIMTSLNILRGPIAHCCPLAPDEVIRLGLTMRDWFRLME